MKMVILIFLSMLSTMVSAKYINDLVILGIKYKTLSENYIKTEKITGENGIVISYGNKECGFLTSSIINNEIKIIAPCYNSKINFYKNKK